MIAPAIKTPKAAGIRDALKMNPAPVARIRVGYNSGNHVDIQVNCPEEKQPRSAAIVSTVVRLGVHRNITGVSSSDSAKYNMVIDFLPKTSARNPNAT